MGRLARSVHFTVSSPKKVDLSFLSDLQPREHGPRLNLLTEHIKMTRKFVVVLLEMQFSAIRECPRNMSKLFGRLTKNEELKLWRFSCTYVYGRLVH